MVGVTIFLLLIIHTSLRSEAMIVDIAEKLDSGQHEKLEATMYSKADFPLTHFIVYDPIVTINVVFTREGGGEGSLEVLVFEKTYENFIGHVTKDTPSYCCTTDLKDKHECDDKNLGEVIRRPTPQGNIHDFKVHFLNSNLTSFINLDIPVNITGNYAMLIVNCANNGVGNVMAKGTVTWKNPYGFLPGQYYMNIMQNGILALLYLIVLILFSILCIKYRRELMKIQYGILGVISFVLLQEAAWYFYNLGTNKTGYYNITALLFVIFLGNVKQILALVLALFVSIGFGIVKWTLGTARYKIALLAVFHLLFWFLLHTLIEMQKVENKDLVSSWIYIAILIPAAVLTTGFLYWIILSLIRTMQQLTLRRQILKLDMYKSFFGVIVISGILASLFSFYWLYSRVNLPWQKKWIFDSFWDFLYFCNLSCLAFLWRPRMNNTRYGYAEFFTDESNVDENQVPLETVNVIGSGTLTHRKKKKTHELVENKAQEKYDEDRMNNLEKLKLTDFEKDIVEFGLPSDDEDQISIETQLNKME